MSKRHLLYAVMGLISLAMLLFVSGFIFSHIALTFLTSICYSLAIKLLGFGFLLLLLLALLAALGTVWQEIRSFFSSDARALRKLIALHGRREHVFRLTLAKGRQLHYRMQIKQQRLLAANDKKQRRQLFKAVQCELETAKKHLPIADYQALQRRLKSTYRQADIEGLLAVRKQLMEQGV